MKYVFQEEEKRHTQYIRERKEGANEAPCCLLLSAFIGCIGKKKNKVEQKTEDIGQDSALFIFTSVEDVQEVNHGPSDSWNGKSGYADLLRLIEPRFPWNGGAFPRIQPARPTNPYGPRPNALGIGRCSQPFGFGAPLSLFSLHWTAWLLGPASIQDIACWLVEAGFSVGRMFVIDADYLGKLQ